VTTYLLDANVLIALAVAEHVHHKPAVTWLARTESIAICPVVEGALVRFLVRTGIPARSAAEGVRRIRSLPRCEFWPDVLSYGEVELDHVRGHRQVTDAYLAALAAHRSDGRLATFDEALAKVLPAVAFLVPRG
jgi:toxin-antitoxin system PIN domain toxin